MSGPPVIILGVSRSGTTLLKEMLDRSSELAIPSESYFIPQLWDRHGAEPDREAILADLGRIARVREWGVTPDDVRRRLPAEPSFRAVIVVVYRAYEEARGRARFGDKTPSYMQHLELVDSVFPGAQYVHIVRDGRDQRFRSSTCAGVPGSTGHGLAASATSRASGTGECGARGSSAPRPLVAGIWSSATRTSSPSPGRACGTSVPSSD